ncbi:MAG: histidine kinase dimerization/phospho-acceptor domain-containing protein [Erythrobacter sp.]
MFFDDRLSTVLRQRGDSEGGARTQFRQLLDILGNRKYGGDQSLIAAAWLRMDALAKKIPASERAAAIREHGWRFRSADLTAHLADFEPEVASAALNRAELSADDWVTLIPRLPVRARGFLRLREDLPIDVETLLDRLGVHDRGLPRPDGPDGDHAFQPAVAAQTTENVDHESGGSIGEPVIPLVHPASQQDKDAAKPDPDPFVLDIDANAANTNNASSSEISALVERIAQFKRERDVAANSVESAPQLPLGEQPHPIETKINSFAFSTNAAGRVDWADQDVAAMVIGKRLSRNEAFVKPSARSKIDRAFEGHQPIENAPMELKGADAIAGHWIVDAQPNFTEEGNFSGYFGRFRRPAEIDEDNAESSGEADRIRQLLHELRTPITAVQGYAEVIQQQLFGPAPHEYRALAAAIAADAARILAGFEELDRLAKLEIGAIEFSSGETDLSQLIEQANQQLTQVLGPRMAGIEFEKPQGSPAIIGLDQDETESLLWRLMATLAGGCSSGEMLQCVLRQDAGAAQMICELPAKLLAEEDIFTADVKLQDDSVNAGLFGAGFTLRLARAEARAGGGDLVHQDEHIALTLPLLTASDAVPSQSSSPLSNGYARAEHTGKV